MERLLFLAHRIPYPPNKGDKIRSFNLLKQLAQRYEIYLGAFVDDDDDWRHRDALAEFCREVHLVGLNPALRKLYSLKGLLTGEALGLPYYRHPAMNGWVRALLSKGGVDRVLVFSSTMAQYVMGESSLYRVADLVDVDSEKWLAYAQRHRWPLSWLYGREGCRLREFERALTRDFDATSLVTEEEVELLRSIVPDAGERIVAIRNGVDAEYFTPDIEHESPYARNERVLVFTGAMDYWANVDAVVWFANEVFPRIRAAELKARFYVVGSRPTDAVRKLELLDGVRVTGAVPDVRPYLQHAALAVAPLRVARGVQNKVLEALAMAKPVLATPAAIEGIEVPPPLRTLVSDRPEVLAKYALDRLANPGDDTLGRLGRDFVLQSYSWASSVAPLVALLSSAQGSAATAQHSAGNGLGQVGGGPFRATGG